MPAKMSSGSKKILAKLDSYLYGNNKINNHRNNLWNSSNHNHLKNLNSPKAKLVKKSHHNSLQLTPLMIPKASNLKKSSTSMNSNGQNRAHTKT
jgi:hypothetical protein